jgi:hypothetical protein
MDTGTAGKLIRQSLTEPYAGRKRVHPCRDARRRPSSGRAALLKGHDPAGLQSALANLLLRQGVQRFVLETIAPLNRAVGEAWMRGELQVFEEHFYTEQVQAALRGSVGPMRQSGTPRILLTTVPGEQHGIGLLMVEALLAPEGLQCLSLGTQTPFDDIRRCALAFKVNIVALSFSPAFPLHGRRARWRRPPAAVPAAVALWAGGETRRLRKSLGGVQLLPELAVVLDALKSWRAEAGHGAR